jgi:hypothetical protein
VECNFSATACIVNAVEDNLNTIACIINVVECNLYTNACFVIAFASLNIFLFKRGFSLKNLIFALGLHVKLSI